MARSRRAGPFPFQRRLLSRGGGKHQGTPRLVLWREAAGLGLFPFGAACLAKAARALRPLFLRAAESGTAWQNRRALCSPFSQGGGERLGTPRSELWRAPPSRVLSLSGRLPGQGRRFAAPFSEAAESIWERRAPNYGASRRAGPFPFQRRLPSRGWRKAFGNAAPRTMARSRRPGSFPFRGRLPGQGRRFAAPFSEAAESIWERRAPNYGASRRPGPFPFQRRLLSRGWRKAFGNAAPRPMARSRRAGPFPFQS